MSRLDVAVGGTLLSPAGKVDLLREQLQRHDLETLVETGLYQGYGSGLQCLDLVDRYVVFDCQAENVRLAGRQIGRPGLMFEARVGDSGIELPRWLESADGPALFWLDAHAISDAEGCPPFPTLRELQAIANWRHGAASVVLVDDLRMFGDRGWTSLAGAPTLEQLRSFVTGLGVWDAVEADDVLRLSPQAA